MNQDPTTERVVAGLRSLAGLRVLGLALLAFVVVSSAAIAAVAWWFACRVVC